MRFAGKTLVMTGAASGIGKATAELFAGEGASVIAGDIDEAGGRELAATSNGTIQFKRTDVCNVDEIKALMDFAAERTGGIDILFNNAGAGGAREAIDEIDAEGWDRTMNLLLRSVAMGVRHAVPHMIGRAGASIVNTASIAGLEAGYSPTAYAVAKCGVIHLTKVGATDLAKHQIRMNAICPGFIQTNIFSSSMNVPAERREQANQIIFEISNHSQPVRRGGRPEDIAAMVAFLASGEAGFITGSHFVVDGGITAGQPHSWNPDAPGIFDALQAFVDQAGFVTATTVGALPAAAAVAGSVPMRTRLFYGFGSIAYGIKDNGFSVFLLLYYNQIIGLDAGLVGLTLLLALLLDAFIDPAVGHLSDRTRSRWGRRHPWLYASALPIFGCWLALWMPPQGSQTFQLVWLLVFATLVRMSLSLNEVPSIALAPEMTEDYHERTSILGLRYLFGWAGGLAILAAAYGLFRLADPDVVTAADFRAYAITGAIVMLVSVLVSAIGTHRRFARPSAAGMHQPSLRDMAACLKYRPFLILLLATLFGFANQGVTFSLSSFLLAYVWKMGSAEQVLYAGCLFFGVVLALWLARRMGMIYGKRGTAIRLAVLTGVIGVAPYCLLLAGFWPAPGTPLSLYLYLPIVTLSTSTAIATMVTGASLMADVTTAHQSISGKSQEGVFFAGYFFTQKCVTGVGIFVAGQILVLIAFPPQANPATIDGDVVSSLAAAYVVVTIVLALATAAAFSRYPRSADARGLQSA